MSWYFLTLHLVSEISILRYKLIDRNKRKKRSKKVKKSLQNFTESIENISQPGITTITIGYNSLNNKDKQQNNTFRKIIQKSR